MNLCTLYETALINTPDKTAVICGDTSCTYAELDRNSRAYACALKNIGLGKGDRLGLFMYNRLEIIYCYFACFRLGIIAVPTSIFNKRPELQYEAKKCGPKVYIVDSKLFDYVKGIEDQLPSLEHLLFLDPDDKNGSEHLWSTFLDDSNKDIAPVDLEPDFPAAIFFTSGSTGRPKGVTHTHGSFQTNAAFRSTTLQHCADHVFFTTSFLCHCAAPTIDLLPMLFVGGTAVFLTEESAEKALAMMKRHKITHAAASPLLWQEIISDHGCTRDHFTTLQYATSGGSNVPVSLQDAFYAMSGCPLSASLGMTECGGYITSSPDCSPKRGSLGKPIRGAEVRLVDYSYSDVQVGSVGQVLVRGQNVFTGYWQDPENTRTAFHDGWFITGDLARRDEEGYYYFRGRCKNTIIRDCGNVTPEEVETVLNRHPKINDSIVVGVPDAKYGQAVFAFIQPHDSDHPPTVEELTSYAGDRVAERKVPVYYYFVDAFQGEGIMDKINRKDLESKAAQYVKDGTALVS